MAVLLSWGHVIDREGVDGLLVAVLLTALLRRFDRDRAGAAVLGVAMEQKGN
jgi:hypothetical protein